MRLLGVAAGAVILARVPLAFGIPGHVAPIAVITAGYALFQTASNTAVMAEVQPTQRGVIAGLLSLARNLGLITGASVMGAVFAFASAAPDIAMAPPEAVAAGMRTTFSVAVLLIAAALAIALGTGRPAVRPAKTLAKR